MIQPRFHSDKMIHFALGVPQWMGENPFLGFLMLLSLALVISSLVFYRYVFVARDEGASSEIVQIRFEQQMFQRVIQTWQGNEEKFNKAGKELERDIFASFPKSQELTEE